jgi:hypothetical protein
MPSRASSSPPATGGQSLGHWADPFWQAWSLALSRSWQGLGVGLDLQQQSLHRWVLRQQEWVHHAAAPVTPATWMDASLASLRWSAQESQQALQDLLAAALMLRGNLGRDPSDPLLDWWSQQAWQPLQAWSELWSLAGRRTER